MGSFATNIHVKSNQTAAVADALRGLLLEEGYEATNEEPATRSRRGFGSALRAIHLSEPREGWVSLLDSEEFQSLTLAVSLSSRLQTHAIQFLVNDSDSWHYQLFYAGRTLDEFSSSLEDEDFDGDEDSENDEATGGNAADLQRIVQERALQLQQQLLQRMPPEMLAMQNRWRTTGKIEPEEMRQYQAWMQANLPSLKEALLELMGGAANLRASSVTPAADSDRLQGHLEHLRPLLKSGVNDSHVLKLLGEQTTFAEETLRKFLPVIGIAPVYADLSYSYLEDFRSNDLSRESVRLVEHLKFKKASGRGIGPLRLVR